MRRHFAGRRARLRHRRDLGLRADQHPGSALTRARAVGDHEDLSNEAFPFRGAREIDIGFARALCVRITYLGELGYELYIPAEQATHVYDRLVEAGEAFGLRHAGLKALASLRMEKGYRDYGHDIDNTDSVLEAGLGFAVDLKKPGGFIGKDAVLAKKADGPLKRRIVQVSCKDPEPLMFHAELGAPRRQACRLRPRRVLRLHRRRRRRPRDGRRRRADRSGVPRRGQMGSRDRRQALSGGRVAETALRRRDEAHQDLRSGAQIFQHAVGGVVPRRADDAAGRVAAGAARVQTLDRRRVGQAVGEAPRVVDVLNVPVTDAEVLLDLLRVQRERVDDQIARARREAIWSSFRAAPAEDRAALHMRHGQLSTSNA